jgi:hypothetical protein
VFEVDDCPLDRCFANLCSYLHVLPIPTVSRYRSELTPHNLEGSRKDSMIMERLTSSPYIASVFGYCGASQLVEFSDGGNIHDRIKEARLVDAGERPKGLDVMGGSKNKLVIGLQIISAIADLHTFEDDGIASTAHIDMCCHQIVLVDGVYKLNDFHVAGLFEKRQDNGETCPRDPNGFAKVCAEAPRRHQ